MKRAKRTASTVTGIALAVLLANGGANAVAQTAPSAPPDSHAPMAKPPDAASSAILPPESLFRKNFLCSNASGTERHQNS